MARAPDRQLETYFLGAGFSRSVDLPNTAELLTEVHKLGGHYGLNVDKQLQAAYKYFYPEEAKSFVPEVVDFFSVLRANEDVSRGMPGSFEHPSLLDNLRFAIARLLCERLRDLAIPDDGWANVDQIIKPGNVVITSNWDLFVEHYAKQRGVPLRLGGKPGSGHLTLIKLHGSVDWTAPQERRSGWTDADFAVLRELQNPRRPWTFSIGAEDVLRIRALENMNRCWQFIKARTNRPLMVTMSLGKAADVAPIRSMWQDAYYALSATRHLRFVGYSLPDDDIEIRTLLRAGVARGSSSPAGSARVTVINPETQVHIRVRTLVSRAAVSDYGAFVPE
jgi:SIR2-like domain